MELKQIHYFLMLSQNGNMTSVAQSLYITQQALSKSILKLEEELEVPLFDRTVQGLRLTDYGRCLLPYAQKLVRDHDAALMAISEQKHAHKTAIQMGFVSGSFHAGSAVTPAMLSAWEKDHAQSAVFVQESSPEELIRMVLDEDIEIAYIVRPSPALPAGLNAAVLRHDPLAVLLSDSMLPEGVALDFRSLASMPILIGRIGSDPSQEMQGFFEHAGYPPRIMYYNGPISQCFGRGRHDLRPLASAERQYGGHAGAALPGRLQGDAAPADLEEGPLLQPGGAPADRQHPKQDRRAGLCAGRGPAMIFRHAAAKHQTEPFPSERLRYFTLKDIAQKPYSGHSLLYDCLP